MELNWGGVSTPESRRYSSSVRTVFKERFTAALSAIVEYVSRLRTVCKRIKDLYHCLKNRSGIYP